LDRGRGRSKKIWMEVIKKDISMLDLDESMTMDRNKWNERIHVNDYA
jgi:hypothetical protein